jgi:SnoaL-like protein
MHDIGTTVTGQRSDVADIQSVVVRVVHGIDRKQWQSLRALWTDRVDSDYTSLFGGAARQQSADDLIGGWRRSLDAVSTQHLLGPIDVAVSGATASAYCHVRAWHVAVGCPGGDEWVVAGHYTFGLEKRGAVWAIRSLVLDTFHQAGNTKLLEEASARA